MQGILLLSKSANVMSQKYDPPVYIEEQKMKTLKAANSKSVKIYDVMMIIFCSTVSDFDWKEVSSVILEASILRSKIKTELFSFPWNFGTVDLF